MTASPDTYYKATRPDGWSFQGKVDYGSALLSGEVIRHPARKVRNNPSTYLSVSVEPADCTGFSWPCRLFRVEPVGRVMKNVDASPNKRAVSALRVVEELPAYMALGTNGEALAAFIERLQTLTVEQAQKLDAAWGAAWGDAAWGAAWDAAWGAARVAAWGAEQGAAWGAAWGAARVAAWGTARGAVWGAAWGAEQGILARDLITTEQYDSLVRPFRDAGLGEWVA